MQAKGPESRCEATGGLANGAEREEGFEGRTEAYEAPSEDSVIGGRILDLREERLLTQTELAAAARISPSTLLQIEGEHTTPHVSTVRKIARALSVEPEELTRRTSFPRDFS